MNKLIHPDRVITNPYYFTWQSDFRLAGFVAISENLDKEWKTWDKQPHNSFRAIAHSAVVDHKEQQVVPVFYNDVLLPTLHFDCDEPNWDHHEQIIRLNEQLPAIAYFKGNDDWHFAMRFMCFKDRDAMINEFGGECGTLCDLLIGHN